MSGTEIPAAPPHRRHALLALALFAAGCSTGAGGKSDDTACTPTTCAAQGKSCGTISDSCNGTLSCGTCSGSDTCGGGGNANVCGHVPHVVGDCSGLKAPGVWENITPPGANIGINVSNYGMSTIVTDPNNSGTIYAGSDGSGIFRSTDCGSTWVHVNTGTLGDEIGKGATYTITIDRSNSNTLYTSSLYGMNGFFKSTNGGKDWAQILDSNTAQSAPYGGFIGGVAADPNDPSHMLVSWHDKCAYPHREMCYAETKDGGSTWVMREGDASWTGTEGTTLNFLDSQRWLFASQSNGMWISRDQGTTWSPVSGVSVSHGSGQLYRAPNGSYYMGSTGGVLYSADGTSWKVLPGSGNLIMGVIGDGTSVWAAQAFPYSAGTRPLPFQPFEKATLSSSPTFSTFTSPALTSGASVLAYDPDHHLLYSSNYWEGTYRVVVQ